MGIRMLGRFLPLWREIGDPRGVAASALRVCPGGSRVGGEGGFATESRSPRCCGTVVGLAVDHRRAIAGVRSRGRPRRSASKDAGSLEDASAIVRRGASSMHCGGDAL